MEDIILKAEPQDTEYIKQQTPIGNIASAGMAEPENLKLRCGEIFVTNNARKWTFTCTYCNKTTRDVGEFICHIQFMHMNAQYTEKPNNGDNAEELQPMEEENSYNSHEQNTLLQTPNKSITPSIEMISSLENSTNMENLPVSGQFKEEDNSEDYADELQQMENTENSCNKQDQNILFQAQNDPSRTSIFEAGTNHMDSFYTNTDEELTFSNAATSQKNTKFPIDITANTINSRKRKLDTSDEIRNDLTTILKNQAKMLALLTQYSKKNTGATVQIFPIKTTEEMKKANESVRIAADSYVSIIRDIIFPGTLKENFHRLFDTELLINYNFDGVSDKCSLKEHKHLIDAIFEAIKKDGYTYKEFTNDMRQSIKIAKNRHFKKKYDLNKKKLTS